MKVISKIVGQQRQEVASQPTRQLFDGLAEQHPRNLQEEGGYHRSSIQVENRYLPPHRREDGTSTNVNGECSNLISTIAPQRLFVNTNPVTQSGAYNEPLPLVGGTGGTIQPPLGVGTNRGQQIPQPLMQPPPPPDLEAIREAVQELYGSGLRQIGCLKFYKPYPKVIDRENPYPRGYRIPEFSREDRQSTLEHVARFTVQCGDLPTMRISPT